MPIDAELRSFSEIDGPWNGILLGNGVSRAISNRFAYDSLFTVSQSTSVADPLPVHEIQIFDQLNTTNFEQVLSALAQAGKINQILGIQHDLVSTAYAHIRRALIEAVHAIHIPWIDIPTETLI